VIRTVATSLATVVVEYEEAAQSLGATPWRVFWRVTLPLIMPGIVAGAAIAFIVSFDEVVLTLFLIGPRLTTLPVEVFNYVQFRTDPLVAALSVVLVAVSMIGVVLIERALGLRRVLR
jgi:putative spermidine/putrescine transport system permease protein